MFGILLLLLMYQDALVYICTLQVHRQISVYIV